MGQAGSADAAQIKTRDIAKILGRLTRASLFIISRAGATDCYNKSETTWWLARVERDSQNDLQGISERMVLKLRSRDLIYLLDEMRWTISAAGKAWLRRHLSGSDPFQAQQMEIVKKAIDVSGVTCVTSFDQSESPLIWLRQRRGKDGVALIDDAQFSAGERLRSDFTRAQMSPQVTTNWSALLDSNRKRDRSGSSVEILDSVIESKRRFNRAIKAVGPELSDILIDVCCFLKGLEETEAKNKWPRRSAKLVLQMALTRLARHYGLGITSGQRVSHEGVVRQWGADDFRPKIDGEP